MVFPRIVEYDTLRQNIDVEITSLGKCVIQFGNTFVDELRMRVKLRILAFQKAVADTGGRGGLPDSQPLFRDYQQVVVADVKRSHAEVAAFVALDVGVPGIAAVKNNHHNVLHFVADQADEFVQIALFAFGQEVDRVLHTHKISKKFPEIHTRRG